MSLGSMWGSEVSEERLYICDFTRYRTWCEAIVVCAVDGQAQVDFKIECFVRVFEVYEDFCFNL